MGDEHCMLHQGENVEEHLIEHARSLQNQTAGRACVHLHMSKLNPRSRQSYHLRIALNMLTDSIKSYDGELYLLENADVVFLCKGATTHQLHEITHKVRYFFSGDPCSPNRKTCPTSKTIPSSVGTISRSRGASSSALANSCSRTSCSARPRTGTATKPCPRTWPRSIRAAWPACATGSRTPT